MFKLKLQFCLYDSTADKNSIKMPQKTLSDKKNASELSVTKDLRVFSDAECATLLTSRKFVKSNNTFILESTHHRMRGVHAHVRARPAGLLHSRCAAGTRCAWLPFVRFPCFPVWPAASNEPVGCRRSGKGRRQREKRHFYPSRKRRSDGKATLRTPAWNVCPALCRALERFLLRV